MSRKAIFDTSSNMFFAGWSYPNGKIKASWNNLQAVLFDDQIDINASVKQLTRMFGDKINLKVVDVQVSL